jgi:hypothetical protein
MRVAHNNTTISALKEVTKLVVLVVGRRPGILQGKGVFFHTK